MNSVKSGSMLQKWAPYGILILLVLPLAAFSAFVGWNKAFAPLAVLAEHSAWTWHLPVWLGRFLGIAEIIAVVLLLAGLIMPRVAKMGFIAALWITLNNTVAMIVHIIHDETHTLMQSVLVISLCIVICILYAGRANIVGKRSV